MEEIKDLVDYSLARGVLLLPELDTPAHSAYGWDWGPSEGKGNLTTCLVDKWIFQDTDFGMRNVELSAAPPAGQLNPLNENVYHVLGDLYKDFLESFTTSKHSQLPLFHMGGKKHPYLIIEWENCRIGRARPMGGVNGVRSLVRSNSASIFLFLIYLPAPAMTICYFFP